MNNNVNNEYQWDIASLGRMEVKEFGVRRELVDVKVTQNDGEELQPPCGGSKVVSKPIQKKNDDYTQY